MTVKRGRNFLAQPGPTPVPERILNAMHRQPIDYSGPELIELALGCFEDLKQVFKTTRPIFIYTASGHGAWEAALANTLSPGDRILVPETGNFALAWSEMAAPLALETEVLESDWRHAIDPATVEARLAEDRFYIVTGTGFATHDFSWIEHAIPEGLDASLVDVTSGNAVLTLMGPKARHILAEVTPDDVANEAFPFATWRKITIGGAPVMALPRAPPKTAKAKPAVAHTGRPSIIARSDSR